MPKDKNKSTKYTDANFEPLPNLEAIAHFNGKTLMTSWHYLDVLAHEHAVAFTVAKMMDEDLLKETRDAISSALENGTDFRDFQKRLKPYLMAKGWWGEQAVVDKNGGDPKDGRIKKVQLGSTRRLRTIYHTNLRTAHAAGRWKRIQQTKDTFSHLQYKPSRSENKRLSHKQYYNIIRPVDDPIWQSIFPPNGYGCKCRVKQLTSKEVEHEKAKAKKSGVDVERDINFDEVTNSRTGQKQQVPAGVEPSFAHNHGDRLGAILKIAEDKHGSEFTKRLQAELDDYVLGLVASQTATPVVSFAGLSATEAQVQRLLIDPSDNTPKPAETRFGAEYEQYFDVELERLEPMYDTNGNRLKGADFAVKGDRSTVDVMLAIEPDAIEGMNRSLQDTRENKQAKAWRKLDKQIRGHLEKSDIVPMDIRNLNQRNRIKLFGILLSLTPEQQKRLIFVHGD